MEPVPSANCQKVVSKTVCPTGGSGVVGRGTKIAPAAPDGGLAFTASDQQTGLSLAHRRLNLGATPTRGTLLSTIDMDLTVDCNLRCTYCFKEKWDEHMDEQVAFDAIIWLLHASGPATRLNVNFMGGEPLIRFPLIKRLVPFAKRRAWQMGKSIHFGVTTNCTLVSDEVIAFWRKWGMGFHTSIDGTPGIQDQNRPTARGGGSSRLVERAVPKILAYKPNVMARSTVTPETVGSLVDSYQYFRDLGYVSICFTPAAPGLWSQESIATFANRYSRLGDILVDEFRGNRLILLSGIDAMIEAIVSNQRREHACGAGRGTVLIDIRGDIWPCHRWNKKSEQAWRIGSIYEKFDDLVRAQLDCPCHSALLGEDCDSCLAKVFCCGGCLAQNLEETGDVFKPHVNSCELTRVVARTGQRVHDVLHGEKNALFFEHYYERGKHAP